MIRRWWLRLWLGRDLYEMACGANVQAAVWARVAELEGEDAA